MLVQLGLRDKSGNKDSETLLFRPRPLQEVWNLEVTNLMAIEEHQAGELGVQWLYYLYKSLKATSACESQ